MQYSSGNLLFRMLTFITSLHFQRTLCSFTNAICTEIYSHSMWFWGLEIYVNKEILNSSFHKNKHFLPAQFATNSSSHCRTIIDGSCIKKPFPLATCTSGEWIKQHQMALSSCLAGNRTALHPVSTQSVIQISSTTCGVTIVLLSHDWDQENLTFSHLMKLSHLSEVTMNIKQCIKMCFSTMFALHDRISHWMHVWKRNMEWKSTVAKVHLGLK